MFGKQPFSKKLTLAAAVCFMVSAPMHASAANKLIVNGADGVTPKFVVTDKGYVGAGTNAPVVGLHVQGTGPSDAQAIVQNINPTVAGATPTAVGGGYVGYFNYPGNGTPYGLPINGDRLGYFLFGSYSADGTTTYNQAGFNVYAAGDWSSISTPTEFVFLTTPVGSSGKPGRQERLRISSNGNIVIGFPQTTPATDYTTFQKLEVNGGARLNTSAAIPDCDNAHDIRGTIWFTKGSAGVKDALQVCASDGTTLAWRPLW